MAVEEIKKIISIDTSGAVSGLNAVKDSTGQSFNSIKEYKQYIDKTTASMLTLDEGSDEYAATAKQVQEAQDKLNKVMGDAKSQADAADGSYNALQKQMNELKKAWKATNDEAERNALGEQIKSLNDQLKGFDASIGNYQREVGNYKQAFSAALGELSEGLDQVVPGTKKVTEGFTKVGKAMKALIANPIGAVITAVVLAFKLLKEALEKNEKAMASVKKSWAQFQVILEPFKKLLSWIAEKFAELLDKVVTGLPKVLKVVENVVNGIIKGINFIATPFEKLIGGAIDGLAALFKLIDKIPGVNLSGFTENLNNAADAVRDFNIGTVDFSASIDKLDEKITEAGEKFDEMGEKAEETAAKIKTAKEIYDEWANDPANANAIVQGEIAVANWERALAAQSELAANAYSEEVVEEPVDEIDPVQEQIDINNAKLDAMRNYNSEYFNLLTETENLEWIQQEARLNAEGATDEKIVALREAHQARLNDIAADGAKAQVAAITSQAEMYAGSLGDLFGAISDLFEEGSEEAKAFQIAQATMNMLSGVAMAVATAMQLGPIAGPIVGAINAATVIATGIAQIAKIKQTTLQNNEQTATTPTVSTSATAATSSFTQAATTSTASDLINYTDAAMTATTNAVDAVKVYVVEQDIQDAGKRVTVRETESTF